MADRNLDYVKITGPGVDALEARKELSSSPGPEISEAELANSLGTKKMTAKALSQDEWELAKVDAEVEKILAMSDEEVLAEFRKEGLDPEMEAAKMQLMIDRILGRRVQ